MPERQPAPPARDKPRLLRNPSVVAALVAAVAAGVFALLEVVIKPDFWTEWRKAMSGGEAAAPATAFDLKSGPVSARLAEMQRALAHRVAGKPDLETRRRAITALVTLSGEAPPDAYYAQAIGMLTQYVRDNIAERRGPGEEVDVDRRVPTYRPRDIIAALEGLQAIRRAGPERAQVALDGVDFRQINLEKLDLEGFYFAHADFTSANLSDCRCRGADFRHARLRGTAIWGTTAPADFRDVNFLAADLSGSRWANVDFAGSNIEQATGLGQLGLLADARGLTPAQRAKFQ